MLKVLQVSFISLVAVAIGAFSVWRYYHGDVWWLAAIIPLIGFIALLSGYFWGSHDAWHNRLIEFILKQGLSDVTRALISNVLFLVITILLIYLAVNAKPDKAEYYEVRVFKDSDIPKNYMVGASVTLHTRTDGITHQQIVDKEGGAVFWKISCPTNYVYQIDLNNIDPPFATGGSDVIENLPGLMKINVSDIPASSKIPLTSIQPEEIIYNKKRTSDYLSGSDERGDADLQKANAPWGVPSAKLIINRLGYVLGYEYEKKMLSWVAYSVFPNDQNIQRPDNFIPDPAIPLNAQASVNDYSGSGYDKGHMISPADLFFKGPVVTEESFYLSTITPQKAYVNRRIWANLEARIRKVVENTQQPVYITAGPLFIKPDNEPMFTFKTIGEGNIPVPTHFFRIIAKQTGNEVEVISFVVPNIDSRGEKLENYRVSVSEIERKSGLIFFPLLEDEISNSLKDKVQDMW